MSDELKPRNRTEQYYEYMATGENAAELKPRSRQEQWFEKIAEGGGTDIGAIAVTESDNQLVIALQDSEGQTIVQSTPVGIQEALVSGENVKTINGQSILGEGNITIADKFPFDSSWITDSTVDTFCACVDSDANAVEGMSFLGGVTFTDFPSASLNNADLVVEVMSGTGISNKVIHLVLTSGDIAPYRWEYTYWMSGSHTSGWIANVTTSDLADKMDKNNPIGTGSLFMNAKEGTSAWYSATFGQNCTVKADGGFAEGYKTIAAGNYCHTEGNQTYANSNSHAEGWGTYALGSNTHAEGEGSVAKGFQSHAEGGGVAKSFRYVGPNQLYGEYFTENPTTLYHTDDPIRILGISDLYPNYVDSISSGPQSGSYYYCYLNLRYNITVESGTTYVGVVKGHEADGNYSHIEGHNNITYGNNSHVEGLGNEARSRSQHIFGEYNTIDTYGSSDTRGTYVEIVGKGTAANNRSNARTLDWSGNEYIAGNLKAAGLTDGTTTKTMTEILAGSADKMDKQDPTGTGSLSLNRKANTIIGTNSVAVGNNTTASGTYSFAEGDSTKASGNYSHAEGSVTTASANYAHAEGGATKASSSYAHAEGDQTTASGKASHAEGSNTTANHKSQHVFGEYNILDANAASSSNRGDYIEIVGNGTESTPSNARTLDWSGNEYIAGNMKINKTTLVNTASSDTSINLPSSSGTIALVSQIPSVPTYYGTSPINVSGTTISYEPSVVGTTFENEDLYDDNSDVVGSIYLDMQSVDSTVYLRSVIVMSSSFTVSRYANIYPLNGSNWTTYGPYIQQLMPCPATVANPPEYYLASGRSLNGVDVYLTIVNIGQTIPYIRLRTTGTLNSGDEIFISTSWVRDAWVPQQ